MIRMQTLAEDFKLQNHESRSLRFPHKETKGNFCIVGFDSDNKDGEGPLFEYNHFQHQDLGLHVKRKTLAMQEARHLEWVIPIWTAHTLGQYSDTTILRSATAMERLLRTSQAVTFTYNNSWVDNNGSLVLRHGDSTAVLGNYFEEMRTEGWSVQTTS